MNAKEARKFDKYERETAFMDANRELYPAGSPGTLIADLMRPDILLVRQYAAGQISGVDERSMHIEGKQDDLDDLIDIMKQMDNAAVFLADEHPGIENVFGVPRNRSERSILAAARAQHDLSEQYETAMKPLIAEPADFRGEMLTLINNIDAANAAADVSGGESVGSTGGLKDALARLGKNSKKLDAVNRNKFRRDPVKLAEWLTASHLERDPRRKGTPVPTA